MILLSNFLIPLALPMTNILISTPNQTPIYLRRPTGVGSCAGQDSIPNDAYKTLVDTNDAWISKRTGIRNRHVIKKGSNLREIAVESAQTALQVRRY